METVFKGGDAIRDKGGERGASLGKRPQPWHSVQPQPLRSPGERWSQAWQVQPSHRPYPSGSPRVTKGLGEPDGYGLPLATDRPLGFCFGDEGGKDSRIEKEATVEGKCDDETIVDEAFVDDAFPSFTFCLLY